MDKIIIKGARENNLKNIDIENVEDIYWKLSFFIVYDRRIILDELVNELNNSKNIKSLFTNEEKT